MELPTTLHHELQMKMNNSFKQLTKCETKTTTEKKKTYMLTTQNNQTSENS